MAKIIVHCQELVDVEVISHSTRFSHILQWNRMGGSDLGFIYLFFYLCINCFVFDWFFVRFLLIY